MLYGQIKIAELGTLAKFLNDHQGAIAGGLGGGLVSGMSTYLGADSNKLKKGLLGAIPGALAGGYVGNKYDNSFHRNPFITHEQEDISNKAWHDGFIRDETSGESRAGPEVQAWIDENRDRNDWLWEKPFGVK